MSPDEHKAQQAHLVNRESVQAHSLDLIEMLEKCRRRPGPILTLLDRRGREQPRRAGDLLDEAQRAANTLRNRDLQRGDRVILLLSTGAAFVSAFFGSLLAGGVPVPVSPPLPLGDTSRYAASLRHVVRNSGARFLICSARARKLVSPLLTGEHRLEELVSCEDLRDQTCRSPGLPSLSAEDPALIQYTSGSTGLPKGAVLSHRALLANICGIVRGIDLKERDVSVSWLPLFHDMGLIGSLLAALYSRAHILTMPPEAFVLDPVGWLRHITRVGATVATAPNFAYHLLASRVSDSELAGLDLSSLKVAINGAEPVDIGTLDAFEKRFSKVGFGSEVIFPVYGMAENCLAATFPTLGRRYIVLPCDRQRLEREGRIEPVEARQPQAFAAVSVGAPLAGQEVAIEAQPGQAWAQTDQVGQILIKSPSLMSGYFENPEASAEVLREGWLHTGDLGFIHDGKLFITGRSKEMIIKRGRNFYPYDIERAAARIEGVRKGCLAAFSVSNPQTGTEDLVLVAETRLLRDGARRRLEKDMSAEVMAETGIRPDQTLLLPPRSIPKTSSGKVRRMECKKLYLEGRLASPALARWLAPIKKTISLARRWRKPAAPR